MDSCNVCGGKDTILVDGFYYCVECGTQDVNVRETVIEYTVVGDGTFAHTTSRKFTTIVQDGVEMSSEWHKWHIFNFILLGLTDELIALGAKPTLKMKVLWIWTKYVKQYQVKDDLQSESKLDIKNDEGQSEGEENKESDREDSSDDDSDCELRSRKSRIPRSEKDIRNLKTITKGTLLAILYAALNLDRSDIQLSHLFRFIKEGRLSLIDCMKYVPKELKLNTVKNWKSFALSGFSYKPLTIRYITLTCFKVLKLGVPLVPNLRKIVRNLVQELCLPNDVKELVFALMHFMQIDFLDIDAQIQKSLKRIPDYEGVCMAYLLVALKICFGLDDDYEIRISNEIDRINDEENYLKAYKLGFMSESCDRLFSFNEWIQHLMFRRYILSKNYLPMDQHISQIDDYVFMEHLAKRKKREIRLFDEVTMDILNKVKLQEPLEVIPKSDFPVTLTPMSTYIDVIAQHVKDPDCRLLLSEDFTQYSLRYAIKDLAIPGYVYCNDNPIGDLSESGKTFNKCVMGTLGAANDADFNFVYVRDCQNKNWLKTEPPKTHHVSKVGQNDDSSDKDSDHGYDSNVEGSNNDSVATQVTNNDDNILETFDELDVNENIFGSFNDKTQATFNNSELKYEQEDNFFETNYESVLNTDSKDKCQENENSSTQFDVNVFDRDAIIEDLISMACKAYRITKPKEKTVKNQNKRRAVCDGTTSGEPKKPRTSNKSNHTEAKRELANFISAYYNSLHKDILDEVSQQVKSITANINHPNSLDPENVFDTQSELDSNVLNNESVLSNADQISQAEIDKNDKENSDEHNQSDATDKESIEGEELQDLFLKSDPKFDEKEYDIRQLYVKLGEDLQTNTVSISEICHNPRTNEIIMEQIEKFSSNDINNFGVNKISDITTESDSDDEIPLITIKEYDSFEQEKRKRKTEILDPLITDPSSVKAFKYWIRHYKTAYMIKSINIAKKFDFELNENLSISFVFIIRECASIIGCSMFSLYKHMQNIEDILVHS